MVVCVGTGNGHLETIRVLLALGADALCQDSYGDYPMVEADPPRASCNLSLSLSLKVSVIGVCVGGRTRRCETGTWTGPPCRSAATSRQVSCSSLSLEHLAHSFYCALVAHSCILMRAPVAHTCAATRLGFG